MKKTLLIISCISLLSCSNNEEPLLNESKNEQQVSPVLQTLPKFETVEEMLADASDFYEENGSLKFISNKENDIHVQVSKPILDTDLESVKEEVVKRDIVYVAFQTFAQTNVNSITITSIPNKIDSPTNYNQKYKKTIKIDREKAKSILKNHIGTEDFSELYELNGTLWLPNQNFSKLKFKDLNAVFEEMFNK